MIKLTEKYKKRPIRFLGLYLFEDWTVKIYGISYRNESPAVAFIENATGIAKKFLPLPAIDDDRYGAAIVIAHEGREGNFLLLDYWTGENMLSQKLFFASPENFSEFKQIQDSGLIACVWEMQVLHFESNAWIEHILKNETKPDFESYFAKQMNTEI